MVARRLSQVWFVAALLCVMLAGCSSGGDASEAGSVSVASAGSEAAAETPAAAPADGTDAPSTRGALHVDGAQLVAEDGEPIQLRGVSTHGLAWFPEYVNDDFFGELREGWGANVVRLAMYTAEGGGYCTDGDQAALRQLVDDGVRYATDNDLYVIVDWHILSEQSPLVYADEAEAFFRDVSAAYADHNNVIYEICNEPNGSASWADIKAYAERIIPVIRENDPDSVIIVGTPTWSQEVDKAAADPLDFDNVMYTLHFYAATHKEDLRNRMTTAVEAGLPVFVTEFGICDASGNGALDIDQANAWVAEMDRLGVSYVMWNLSNKAESSAAFVSTCTKASGFAEGDLSPAGQWLLGVLGGARASGVADDGAGDPGETAGDTAPTSGATATGETRLSQGDFDILVTLRSSWEDGDKTVHLYDLTIHNTGSAVDGWSVDIPFAGSVELTDQWNGSFVLDGQTLHVSGVDYNSRLDAGASVTDVGFIVAGTSAPAIVAQ